MAYVLINDGVVVQKQPNIQSGFIEADDNVVCGMLFDGTTFSTPPAPPAPVPQVVSMRQARLALLEAGLLDQVSTAIQGAGQAEQIEWEYATEVRRDSALVAAMAAALNLSDAQLDDLFIAAAEK